MGNAIHLFSAMKNQRIFFNLHIGDVIMKRKMLSLILSAVIAASCFGCGASKSASGDVSAEKTTKAETEDETENNESEEKPETSGTDTEENSESETKEYTDDQNASDSSDKSDEVDKKAFNNLLNDINNLEVGTAGSSLKTAATTAAFCDFLYSTPESAGDKLTADFKNYVSSADKDTFLANFEIIENEYREFIDSSEDESSLLDDAGVSNSKYPYDHKKIPLMEKLCETAKSLK